MKVKVLREKLISRKYYQRLVSVFFVTLLFSLLISVDKNVSANALKESILTSSTYSSNEKAIKGNKGNIPNTLQTKLSEEISVQIHNKMILDNPLLVGNDLNQNFHFNNPQGFSNDVTSIYPHYNSHGEIDYYEGYYLWSSVGKSVGDQEWYHFKTYNLSTFLPYDD
ncbi:hypothetical protein [Fructobacillus durionis]|uniref:Uncharacterized protein n=1 Tax=Fructobacillus durionis TaxID=283737 RepID=A0A1I1E2D5_9LACO|nr:hypothetical protein [Fructobacillus durionis]SFB81439.1 hypothetical protein SAMN05660453_0264 [Fructobacillus durionis]